MNEALLSYRSTPLTAYGLGPAELLMGRETCTDVPLLQKMFIPEWTYFKMLGKLQEKQKQDFYRRTEHTHFELFQQMRLSR